MARRIRVGVIFGGRSGEHEVSIVSADSVIRALDPARFDPVPIGITQEGKWVASPRAVDLLRGKRGLKELKTSVLLPDPRWKRLVHGSVQGGKGLNLDIVLPLVHGTHGEDGTIQGLLELTDIPYVGSGVAGSALGMDKVLQKKLFAAEGIPVAKYRWFLSSDCRSGQRKVIREIEAALRYPLFVKPANTGSSVGISKAHDRTELKAALVFAGRFDRKVLVEEGIRNVREIEVGVLGNENPETSVPGEVIPSNEFYDYDAKYVDGKSIVVVPAALPGSVAARVKRYAATAFTSLDCCGMARVDFLVTKTNRIILNEVNTIPGFTSISMYPKLWEATGLRYRDLLTRLIKLGFERHREKQRTSHRYRPGKAWYRSG